MLRRNDTAVLRVQTKKAAWYILRRVCIIRLYDTRAESTRYKRRIILLEHYEYGVLLVYSVSSFSGACGLPGMLNVLLVYFYCCCRWLLRG